MNKTIYFYIFLFISIYFHLFLFISLCYAQDAAGQNEIIEQTIEVIAEEVEDEEIDYTTLFDELTTLYQNPLNLNVASKEQLEGILLLNEFQINNLLKHIEYNGKLMSIYEMQAIEGFDLNAISRILPFVKVSKDIDAPRISVREMLKDGKHEMFIRYQRVIEEQEGFTPSDTNSDGSLSTRYAGSPDKLYSRYRFNYNNKISWGFTAEKDAGEEFNAYFFGMFLTGAEVVDYQFQKLTSIGEILRAHRLIPQKN